MNGHDQHAQHDPHGHTEASARRLYRTIVNATGELVAGALDKSEALSTENFAIGTEASKLDDPATVMLATLGAERIRLTSLLHEAAETMILRSATILSAANGDGHRRLGGIDNAAADITKVYRELQTIEGAINMLSKTAK